MGLATLKKRAEFLRIRGGGRASHAAFVLEGRARLNADTDAGMPRFGFTVTKQMGSAVVRNRMRRRLRAALQQTHNLARPEFDYVVIARPAAADREFAALVRDFEAAFRRVHEPQKPTKLGTNQKPKR